MGENGGCIWKLWPVKGSTPGTMSLVCLLCEAVALIQIWFMTLSVKESRGQLISVLPHSRCVSFMDTH